MTILPGAPYAVLSNEETGVPGGAFGVYPAPYGPPAQWVGDSPWIDTANQLVSYVVGQTTATKVAWLVDPTPGISGTLRVTTSGTYESGNATAMGVWVHDVNTLAIPGTDLADDSLDYGSTFNPTGGWDYPGEYEEFTVTPEMASVAAAGRLIVVVLIWLGLRLSMLRVEADVETAYPMRLTGRGDGLGMGSGRILGAGTRQGSIRVIGTY